MVVIQIISETRYWKTLAGSTVQYEGWNYNLGEMPEKQS
jgi:hypothetical protein